MTSEQIAELRALTHSCKGGLPPCECDIPWHLGDEGESENAPLPVLQKLLDEREALLGALSGLEAWLTRNVWAEFTTGDAPQRYEPLINARHVLNEVCKP